jgi:small-conductance mechanosensitive channel
MAQGGERDWSAALALLHRAGEAIRANAERAETMEAHARALWARASEEIERAQARINELEARLQAAEARAAAAEAQVAETREWAGRIHEAIQAELAAGAPLLRSRIEPAPSEAAPNHGPAESAGMNGVLAGVAEALDGVEAPPA